MSEPETIVSTLVEMAEDRGGEDLPSEGASRAEATDAESKAAGAADGAAAATDEGSSPPRDGASG